MGMGEIYGSSLACCGVCATAVGVSSAGVIHVRVVCALQLWELVVQA